MIIENVTIPVSFLLWDFSVFFLMKETVEDVHAVAEINIFCDYSSLSPLYSALDKQVGIAFDHLPLRKHFSIFAPRKLSPESQEKEILSPIA